MVVISGPDASAGSTLILLKNIGISVPDRGRIRLLLVHGGDAKHLPFDVSELCGAGFAYCALGHIHKPQILKAGKAAYCGSPEPLDLTETGPHGFYKGEINDVTRELVSLTFVPVSKLQYISLAANVTPESTNTELLMSIGDEIRRRGLMNIYRLRIRGKSFPVSQ